MATTPPDREAIKLAYRVFVDCLPSITSLDEKIFDLLLSSQVTPQDEDNEMEVVSEFKKRAEALRIKAEKLTCATVSEDALSTVVPGEFQPRIRIPEIEFQKFGGKLTDWLGFWARFDKINKSRWDAGDKHWFLMQSLVTGSEPFRLVERFPQTEAGYVEAVETLKRRYGDETMLLHVYVRELYRILMDNVKSKEKRPFLQMFNDIDSHFRVLKSLRLEQADPATLIFLLVESCLPEDTLNNWQRSALSEVDGAKEVPPRSKLDILLDFMEKEVQIQRRIDLAKSFGTNQPKPKEEKEKKQQGKFKMFQKKEDVEANFHVGENLCLFCGKNNHHSRACFVAKQKSYNDRMTILRKNGACFKCFDQHLSRDCSARISCKNCGGAHHIIICPNDAQRSSKRKQNWNASPNVDKLTKRTRSEDHHHHQQESREIGMTNMLCSGRVFLQTLKLKIGDGKSQRVVRAFLDSGSQRSYILSKTAKEMSLKKKRKEVVVHSLFGGQQTERLVHGTFDIILYAQHCDRSMEVEVRDQPQICDHLPRLANSNSAIITELNELDIQLSDSGIGAPPIELLIGADLYGRLLTGEVRHLKCGPVAVHTIFGWTIIGENPGSLADTSAAISTLSTTLTNTDLASLWELEALGIKDPIEVIPSSQLQQQVKEDFIQKLKRDEEGRYIVKLPRREGISLLPTNRDIAFQRLETTTRKLKAMNLLEYYSKLFLEWKREGFIEEVTSSKTDGTLHYLPHRAVVKQNSLTTPVRPVFDASCKRKGFPSLNDCLFKGTNHILLIPDVLLRFREKKVAFSSDIRKAFQMISIDDGDKDLLRFLWWSDPERKQILEYRHVRVPFGATSSPFILGAVLEEHLTRQPESLQTVSKRLLKYLYVDNCLGSLDTEEEYLQFRNESTAILKDACMDLRMWQSNIDAAEDPDTAIISVLGMKWHREEDVLFVDISKLKLPEKITKRTVLSTVQQVFDPIGVLCPATIPIKLLLQRAWLNKRKWDDDLPQDERKVFSEWCQHVAALQEIRIPRQINGGNADKSNWTFCVFNDASKFIYATVIYLRVDNCGDIRIHLLAAKSRLAPLKSASIPRLELLACLIGARLAAQVVQALDLQEVKIIYLTDSTTALAWIWQNENLGTFIGNRTSEINRLTNKQQWSYIPGNLNPADLPSRGCSINDLKKSEWWRGPHWLYGLKVKKDRVETRLVYRDDLDTFKFPAVLPGKHPFVMKLISDLHRQFSHAGAGFLVSELREKYWVLHTRQSVKRVIGRCFKCRRYSSKSTVTEMGGLPEDRVRNAQPFEITGVDLAGPFILKNMKKIWLVVYTCAVYRAIHFELVV